MLVFACIYTAGGSESEYIAFTIHAEMLKGRRPSIDFFERLQRIRFEGYNSIQPSTYLTAAGTDSSVPSGRPSDTPISCQLTLFNPLAAQVRATQASCT